MRAPAGRTPPPCTPLPSTEAAPHPGRVHRNTVRTPPSVGHTRDVGACSNHLEGVVVDAAHAAAVEGAELKLVGVYDASTSNYAPGLIIPQDVIEAYNAAN